MGGEKDSLCRFCVFVLGGALVLIFTLYLVLLGLSMIFTAKVSVSVPVSGSSPSSLGSSVVSTSAQGEFWFFLQALGWSQTENTGWLGELL